MQLNLLKLLTTTDRENLFQLAKYLIRRDTNTSPWKESLLWETKYWIWNQNLNSLRIIVQINISIMKLTVVLPLILIYINMELDITNVMEIIVRKTIISLSHSNNNFNNKLKIGLMKLKNKTLVIKSKAFKL